MRISNSKKFKPIVNSENGETTEETIFEYKQDGNIVTATYSGGEIVVGHLIGLVDEHGNIEMRYHQVNTKGDLMTGICFSNLFWTAACSAPCHLEAGQRSAQTTCLRCPCSLL